MQLVRFLSRGGLRVAFIMGLVTMAGMTAWLIARPQSAQAACAALPTDKGQATFTVNITTAGNYRVWSRVWVPSAGNDSFYMQVDQLACNVVVGNGGTMPANQFTWVDWTGGNSATKFNVNLGSGSHTVTMAGLEASVGVDKVMFLSDATCVPTGDGANCQETAAPTTTPVPTGSGGGSATPTPTPQPLPKAAGNQPVAVTGAIDLTTLSSNPNAVKTYLVDGKQITGSTVDTTKLADGEHTVTVVEVGSDGQKVTTTRTISVQNKWYTRLVAGLKQYWPVTAAALLVVLVGVGSFIFRWWHLRQDRLEDVATPRPSQAMVLPEVAPEKSEVVPADSKTVDDDTSATHDKE